MTSRLKSWKVEGKVAPRKKSSPVEAEQSASPFMPWSLPAAVFLMLGIIMAQQSLPPFIVLASCASFGVVLFVAAPKYSRVLLPLILLLPLGYGRFSSWAAQGSPVVHLTGQTLTLSGVSDGTYLTLDDPKGARVVLSPKGEVGAGRVELTGTFLQPATKRNPGGFDYAGYLRRRGVVGQVYIEEVVSSRAAKPSLKERMRRGVVAGLGERQAALMQAMTLGVRDNLGELRELFATSGLAHILALSGLHVGILVTVLGFAFRPLGLRRYPFLILLVIGFVFLVGPSPSIVRAGAMTCAALGFLWYGAGRIEAWASLGLAALLTLLWNPSWLFDISFQLSYLAVMGLLLFTGPLMRGLLGQDYYKLAWWHPAKLFFGSIIVSLAAQLLTLPLVASSFGSLPIFSPLTNIIAIPLATVLVPLGFLAGLLGLIALPLASLLNFFTGLFASGLIWVAQAGSKLPNLVWGEVSPLGYTLFYIAIFALVLAVWKKLRFWRALLIVTTAALCSALSFPLHQVPEVIFFDVGQGDSALIRLPGRKEILIDGGGTPWSDFDVGARTVVPALKALGVDELELVIASHSDTDHIEGLISVLDRVPVKTLIIGVRNDGNKLFDSLMAAAERNRVEVVQVTRGETLRLGDARLDILNPPRNAFEEVNDNSVAFVLNYKEQAKALFLGDASIEVEKALAFPDVEILMAGHHGSKHSTSDALLAAAQPEHVVFSYGRNNYGHPHPALVDKAKKAGAQVYETYHLGAVRLGLEPAH